MTFSSPRARVLSPDSPHVKYAQEYDLLSSKHPDTSRPPCTIVPNIRDFGARPLPALWLVRAGGGGRRDLDPTRARQEIARRLRPPTHLQNGPSLRRAMSHSHQFPPPPPSIPKPTLTPPPTTSKPLSAVMICRRPAEPSGGALNHPAIARRGALVSSTSCGTSERKSASVPAAARRPRRTAPRPPGELAAAVGVDPKAAAVRGLPIGVQIEQV